MMPYNMHASSAMMHVNGKAACYALPCCRSHGHSHVECLTRLEFDSVKSMAKHVKINSTDRSTHNYTTILNTTSPIHPLRHSRRSMATASRTRRPVMATPPPKTKANATANTYTIEEKQQLLDNFDLEGEWMCLLLNCGELLEARDQQCPSNTS